MKNALLALLCWWPAIGLAVTAQDSAPIPSITVSGSGEAFANPDMADLELGVVSQAETAVAALQINSEAVAKLLSQLREFGIPDAHIHTQNISLNPQYQFQGKRSPQITGFEVKNRVAVKIKALDRLGKILSGLVAAGGNILSRVRLGVADPSPVLDEARRAALADAKHKAHIYANAAGVKLGRPVLIREDLAQPAPPRPLPERASVAAADVPVMPGETSFTVQLSVTFAIK